MKTTVTKQHLSELSSDNPKVKYRRAKSLVAIGKKNPDELYPHYTFFVKLLTSENNILKWIAIDIIGYCSLVDKKNRVDKVLDTLVDFLQEGKLITASHAIGALSQVAIAKPKYQNRVTQELLGVANYNYETEECRNIALGKVIDALGAYLEFPIQKAEVVAFIKQQTMNTRPATRKRAEKFLKRIERSTAF
jgi:hypothetical protein